MLYVFAFLIGISAGLRTFTAPAVVSWAARLGWLKLSGTPLGFLGAAATPWVLTIGGGNHVPNGNVRIEGNDGLFFRVADNVVGGNLTITGNTGPATKRVLNNTVVKNMTCTENDPPFVIGGNVALKLIGQCGP